MQRFEVTDLGRVLPGYVWYPAPRNTRGTRPYLTSAEVADQGRAMARNFSYAPGELDALDKVSAHSVEGAPPTKNGTAFPILIFSHGYDCYPAQNTALLEQLASHGYIAISVAHPHDAADLRLANGTLLQTAHPAGTDPEFAALRKQLSSGPNHDVRTAALEKYPQALSRDRLGASLTAWRDDLVLLTRRIETRDLTPKLRPVLATGDTDRLAFIGMSFGGAAAASTCKRVKQCRAVINLDGGNYDPELFDAAVGRPLLLLMSDWVHLPLPGRPSDPEFTLNDYSYEPWSKAGLDPDIIRVRIDGMRHMGFTDLTLLMGGPEHEARFGTIPPRVAAEAIASASLAFLDHYLKTGSRMALDRVIHDRPVLQVHSPESVRRWAQARGRHAG